MECATPRAGMGTKMRNDSIEEPRSAVAARKRVILSMGGKGGVGKTSLMTCLAEWFGANQIPVKF